MSAGDAKSDPPFRIGSSARTNQELRERVEFAATLGKHKEFLRALRQIMTRLQNAPNDFGECRYELHKGKMRCHIGVLAPAAIHFAIHEESRNVIVLRVFLLGS